MSRQSRNCPPPFHLAAMCLWLVLALGLAVTPQTAQADVIEDMLRSAQPTAAFVGRTPEGAAYIVTSKDRAMFIREDRKRGLVVKHGDIASVAKLIITSGWRI